jgi:hypothetical protein
MTSGSMSASASSREVAAKKKEDPFVVPTASVRSNSVASTSRVGGAVPVRSTHTTGVTGARSLAAKKNEMEVKVCLGIRPHSNSDGQANFASNTQLKDAHSEVEKLRKEIVDCKREIDDRERLLAEVREKGVEAVSMNRSESNTGFT